MRTLRLVRSTSASLLKSPAFASVKKNEDLQDPTLPGRAQPALSQSTFPSPFATRPRSPFTTRRSVCAGGASLCSLQILKQSQGNREKKKS